MTVDISKEAGFAVGAFARLGVGKQTGYAGLVYPRATVGKALAYAQLAGVSVQAAKQGVYAVLREPAEDVETVLVGGLALIAGDWRLVTSNLYAPPLTFSLSVKLVPATGKEPAFTCQPQSDTTWTQSPLAATAWACATPQTTPWTCTPSHTAPGAGPDHGDDVLADIDLSIIIYIDGEGIKLASAPGAAPTPTPAPAPTPTPTPTPTPAPTPTPTPTPSPTPGFGTYNDPAKYVAPRVSALDVFGATAGTYQIPVTLEAPATHTFYYEWGTRNGAGTAEGIHYQEQGGRIVFHPGDQVKYIPLTIDAALSAGQTVEVYFKGFPGHPPAYLGDPHVKDTGHVGNIDGWLTSLPGQTSASIAVTVPTTLLFEETFQQTGPNAFLANDTGFRPTGEACWRSRLGHGRDQPGNAEIGYYADKALNPGTNGWGWDADGFFLQAEYFAGGISGAVPSSYNYGPSNNGPWRYTASMIRSDKIFGTLRQGQYIEARCRMPSAKGAWPAFWVDETDYWNWPDIEIDVFEGFFGNGYSIVEVASGEHWRTTSHGHGSYGIKSGAIRQALPSWDPLAFHTYGCLIGAEHITYLVDGIAYQRQPTMQPNRDMSLLLNVAIQGHAPNPAQFPAKMHIDYVRVYG